MEVRCSLPSAHERVREKSGRKKTPSLVCIDSQSIKGDTNLESKGIDGNKKVKGRKRHIVVDVLGLLLFCAITAANVSDVDTAVQSVEHNNANVLCLGSNNVKEDLAVRIVNSFLTSSFLNEENYLRRVKKIEQ